MKKRSKVKFFKSTEEVVSMFLGLAIVLVVVVLIFNFVKKQKGIVKVPDSNNSSISESKVKIDEPKIYIVIKNDNLWKISEKEYGNGYDWIKIAKENKLKNPRILIAGQKLILPKIEKKETVAVVNKTTRTIEKGEYKVVRGDNLWKIAVSAYGDGYQWTKIWQANKKALRNPGLLEIGMVLMIE